MDTRYKIFHDSVHGHIEVNEACLAIIDTPQFQRLRFIKQLGFCYYVYPGASHNRFEHSIGVYYLAGKMVRSLKSQQPELDITPKEILCVEIAALCHDLGHGPHSHMFDGKFIPRVRGNMDWKHEQASLDMLDYLIEDNGFMQDGGVLRSYGLDDIDIVFIKELINGPLENPFIINGDWPYKGRTEDKAFLYEIVSNKKTGIDVDKWEYFARDCHHLGIVNNFDHERFIKFVKVLDVDGQKQICARDKEIGNLYQMFYTRYTLHCNAYQHKVSIACELMAVDALVLANDVLTFSGRDGIPMAISESIKDMSAYINVTDNILWQIYTSQDEELNDAKTIVKRLFCRDLYHFVDEKSVSERLQETLQNTENKVTVTRALGDQMIQLSKNQLRESDFRLQIVEMDFGRKNKDPLQAMRYYSKGEPNTPKEGNTGGLLLPSRFRDNRIRVYSCMNTPEVRTIIQDTFNLFCASYGSEL